MQTMGVGTDANETTPLDTSGGALGNNDLLLVAGDGQFSTHELTGADVVIGRGDGCDVMIDHRALSRRHAVFRPGPPSTVQDLGSTNGTHVAGAVRHGGDPVPLRRGDGFRIGPFSFVIVGRAPVERSMSLTGRDLLRVIDPSPQAIPAMVRDFAASPASVLILGETGVGKEVLASTIHELSGRGGPMSRINCAALSESLLESELFGHEKGSFTGAASQKIGLIEAADGGTVFLDELGEMPLGIQAKLLRVVEHREVLRLGSTKPIAIDVRFIAATNRDLPAEVAIGRFRRDLYFRLDGVTLVIPPLRERRGLIGPLALRFLEHAGRVKPKVTSEVLAALESYPWPGNVRELKAVMERAVVLSRGGDLAVKHLTFTRKSAPPTAPPAPTAASASTTDPAIPRFGSTPPPGTIPPPDGGGESLAYLDDEQRADRERVLKALEDCAGNQTRAAKLLGISRTAFVTKLRIYRIPRPRT